jgi:hypothetical protein
MPGVLAALDIFDKFIGIAKELAKLPQLVLPQYHSAARDLYEISQRLLASNENLSRWLYRFLYFDFRQPDARTRFLELVRDYRVMKQGPELRQLKFSCGDIGTIYYRNVASKLGSWLAESTTRREQAEGIFMALSDADSDLVAFTYDHVIKELDRAVEEMEKCVELGDVDGAESIRLQAKSEMRDLTTHLESFAGALADLVISFANAARAPVTLARG